MHVIGVTMMFGLGSLTTSIFDMMFYRYLIFVNGISTDIMVTAMSKYSAEQKYFNTFGSASRYTGVGMNSIEARRV